MDTAVPKNNPTSWDALWANRNAVRTLIDGARHLFNIGLLSAIKNHTPVDSFCELGCGSSTLLVKVAKRAKHVVGMDISEEALRNSRNLFSKKNITNSSFNKADCQNLDTSTQFDTVWSQGLIEHFDDPALIIREHLKITKKGGHSIISVPHKYGYHFLWFFATRPALLRRFWPWPQQIFFSRKMLEQSLKRYCPEQTDYEIKAHPFLGTIILTVHKQ